VGSIFDWLRSGFSSRKFTAGRAVPGLFGTNAETPSGFLEILRPRRGHYRRVDRTDPAEFENLGACRAGISAAASSYVVGAVSGSLNFG
jgi:hypothetical protein